MQKNNQGEPIVCEEDEIDLRELFLTLQKNKKIIILVTSVVTLLALAYAFAKTPIYEARAMLEIGNYKLDNNNNNNKVQLDNDYQLSKKLNILFVDIHKNDKNVKSKIVSITVPKKSNVFLEIKAEGISNALATKSINEVVKYVQASHQKILDDVKKRREFEIENIDRKIFNIKNKETKLLDEKILLEEKSVKEYKHQLNKIDENLKRIEKLHPTLAALKLMQRRNLSEFILKLNMQLLEMRDKKENLNTNVIWDFKEKRNLLKSMLLPYNYKNSEIVGEIMTNDYPVKPKKKLIVVVALITGLILSIFLVFFLEFIKTLKKEDTNNGNLQ